MSKQCTNISDIRDNASSKNNHINETNVSTAQKILQKYNELETGDNDTQKQALNNDIQNRQLDPELQKQQREIELQKQYIKNMQENPEFRKQVAQQNENKEEKESSGIVDTVKNIIENSENKLKDVVIVILLYFALNFDMTNVLIKKYVPYLIDEHNEYTMVGIIAKAVLIGVLFFVISSVLEYL